MILTDRPARPGDAPAIARIYNQGIEDRLATFETEPRSPAQVRTTLEARSASLPAVVVEREGDVIGFAWTSPYSERPCYRGIGELSVYVEREARGAGAGRLALDALLTECERTGYWPPPPRPPRRGLARRGGGRAPAGRGRRRVAGAEVRNGPGAAPRKSVSAPWPGQNLIEGPQGCQ